MNFLKDSQTSWKYILIVTILAIIVGGGTLWFSTRQEVPIKFLEMKKPEKIVEPEGVAEDEITDWKIYRNEKYGFEVKYPSSCLINIKKENEELYFEFSGSTPEDFDICTGGFSVRKNKKQLSLKEWLLDLYDFSQLTFEEIKNSAGIIALRIPIEQNEQFNEKFGGYPWLEAPEEIEYEYLPGTHYWITGNKNWIFSLFHFQDGGLLADEMLSTFRFLE